ncbi:MAG TPA: antitoxin VbhA family protein [Candidatus Saccharimonadales bacterium]|nr:antitoxin VbhA family protein [Candidatus Saccharimonadales bacterium]
MNSPTQKRRKIVEQAIANEKLEGLKVSQESQKIAGDYVLGKMSAKQAAEKIRAYYESLYITGLSL